MTIPGLAAMLMLAARAAAQNDGHSLDFPSVAYRILDERFEERGDMF